MVPLRGVVHFLVHSRGAVEIPRRCSGVMHLRGTVEVALRGRR